MKLLGVSLLLILLSLIENEVAGHSIAKRAASPIVTCPTGFNKLGDQCYFFGINETTWAEALIVCKALSSTLAHPKSEKENSLIKDYIRKNYKPMNWWFGGTDATKDGRWVWTNDKSSIAFTDWLPGKPNNGANKRLGENCVFFGGKPEWAFRWVDAPCISKSALICQLKYTYSQ